MCFVPDESLRSWSNAVPNEIFSDFSSPGKIEDEFGHIHDRYERFGHSRQRSAPDEDPRNHLFHFKRVSIAVIPVSVISGSNMGVIVH